MRETLFRGKRTDSKKWAFGSYLFLNVPNHDWTGKEMGEPSEVHFIVDEHDVNYAVDPETVGQVTGEKEFSYDAAGKTATGQDIFDGDIIEIVSEEDGNGIYLVFWNDEKGGWDWKHLSGPKPSEDYIDAIRVIGNKWDNPELMKPDPHADR